MIRLWLVALLLTGCTPLQAASLASPAASPTSRCQYHYDGTSPLPDPACTPGVADPRVTQDNVQQTICASGYTATVRPSVAYTNRLKIQQLQAYGQDTRKVSAYEEDHYIPLELGGSPDDPRNLWPEPGARNAKDQLENRLHRLVCSSQMSLIDAQQCITVDWVACEQNLRKES